MNFFKEHVTPKLKHYDYTLKHKWNMIGPGREMGLGWGTILKHDLDKLWDPRIVDSYSDYFFGPKGVKGTNDPEVYKRFRQNVEKHYARSPHHYHKIGRPQPMENQKERPVDVYSLLKTTGQINQPFNEWYLENRGKFFK